LELWNLGTLEPWNYGTLNPWNPGTFSRYYSKFYRLESQN
jgi:hypothetical protein